MIALQESVRQSYIILYNNPLTNIFIDFSRESGSDYKIIKIACGVFISISMVFLFFTSADYLILGRFTATFLEYCLISVIFPVTMCLVLSFAMFGLISNQLQIRREIEDLMRERERLRNTI